MTDPIDTEAMDVAELVACAGCGKGVMHSGDIHFYEIVARQCVIDMPNVKRMHGLELMMGGAAPLARVFSPNNTVAHRLPKVRKLFCAACVMETAIVATLAEE